MAQIVIVLAVIEVLQVPIPTADQIIFS